MKGIAGIGIVSAVTLLMIGFVATTVFHEHSRRPMWKMKGEKMETAIFGAGCFWGVEETFRNTAGVESTRVGYTGGVTSSPTYEQVCAGITGHTEAVEVTYDPAKVSYNQLLRVFWEHHNPTQHKKTQYKSVIYYHSRAQKDVAEASKAAQAKDYAGTIETEILPETTFWPAEEYHQHYYEKHGGGGACGI